jgi:hypothetical protein
MPKLGPITGWKPGTAVWVKTATPIGRIYDKMEDFPAVLLKLERTQEGHEVWLIEAEDEYSLSYCCASHQNMDIA